MTKNIQILRKKFEKYKIDGYVVPKMMNILLNIQKLIDYELSQISVAQQDWL